MESSFLSRSSSATSDPLSNVLALLKPRGFMTGGIDAGGDWALSFPAYDIFRCYAIISGHCWLSIAGVPDAICLRAGEFIVLPHNRAFTLASDLSVPAVDILTVLHEALNGRVLSFNGGGSCMALSAMFLFPGNHTHTLASVLPPILHIREEADRATMRWYLERMMLVVRENPPGSVLLGEYLAQMMLIEIIRLHLAGPQTGGVGWLFALTDKQLAAAISAMHQQPARRWTLESLAAEAGMSRSAFALRFKQKVGTSAMDYLTEWRMLLAVDRLVEAREPISAIALSVGYESESAFSFAFKREMGSSPRNYTRTRSAE